MQKPSTATLSTPLSRRYIAAARMSPSAPSQSSEPIRCSASAASTPTFPWVRAHGLAEGGQWTAGMGCVGARTW